jgi:adenine-specific DNA-methyltransferase
MNFIEHETAQKLRGGFYTDPDIAAFLARWVLARQPACVLEPSCGDGVFVEALLAHRDGGKLRRIVAWERDADEAAKARERAGNAGPVTVDIRTGDFLKAFLFEGAQAGQADAVVGNPPFVRYQYLNEADQFMAQKIFGRFGLPFTKHTNAWVPFVIASLDLLSPGGRLGMVLPSEILHIRHAQGLRQILAERCSRILLLDPEELWFEDAQQGIVLLLAEKKKFSEEPPQGVAIQAVRGREILRSDPAPLLESAPFVTGRSLEGKWMRLLLSGAERALLQSLEGERRCPPFKELADVDVGIVTGANRFFLVPDEVVEAFELHAWAHPMFGRSEHVAGLIYSHADHEANRLAGLPTNFLWFNQVDRDAFPERVQAYFAQGEEQGLPQRFKCRVREPWFRVPSVYATPVGMLKRSHHFPRLILNEADAFTTDTAYRIKPTRATAESLVYSFINSLTCLCAELEGRHYGGGVLELVPSEIERLLIPICVPPEAELIVLDRRFRASSEPGPILESQDAVILAALGLSADDQCRVQSAWDRLRRRRQRTPKEASLQVSGEFGNNR